jgi:hypothetical protein
MSLTQSLHSLRLRRAVTDGAKLRLTQPPHWLRRGKHSCRYRIAGETTAATALVFLVAEETAAADDLGNLRRDHVVPGFVAVSNAF